MISSCYLILILVFRCLPLQKPVNPCFGQFFGLFERPKSSKNPCHISLAYFCFHSSLTSLTPRSRRHVPRLARPTLTFASSSHHGNLDAPSPPPNNSISDVQVRQLIASRTTWHMYGCLFGSHCSFFSRCRFCGVLVAVAAITSHHSDLNHANNCGSIQGMMTRMTAVWGARPRRFLFV